MIKIRKIIIIFLLSLVGICILLSAVSAIINLNLPQESPVTEVLSEDDKIRLAETIHIRQQLGDTVWPGWAAANIPMIVYNEKYVFLIGYPDPPEGWVKVPAGTQRGEPWEVVPGDTLDGQPYYRQQLTNPNITPEAFTVRVGDRWVSSLQTFDWAQINMAQTIRQDLPSFLQPIFPYQLFIGQLLSGSDQYISLVLHESFHAYQGMLVPQKLADSENTNLQYERQYPWDDTSLQSDWKTELDLLAEALRSSDPDETRQLSRRFLELRTARRESAQLSANLIAYEQHREWLEGLARYAELEIWRLADDGGYQPLPETEDLSSFRQYSGYQNRWTNEINQISRMADDEGDGRFYYSGMAQAFLLDRLLPGWKERAFEDDIWLEDLLSEAVEGQ
ncbi:MAG TPA: hypothetical protein VLH85_07430 [Levilinea sp.]|nr:hypothetical protein [Levilinea sp.]